MDIHKNARLSFRSREALARFVLEQGATRKAAAAAFRVSPKTAAQVGGAFSVRRRWMGCWTAVRGRTCSPRQTSSSLVEKVVVLRRGAHARLRDRAPHRAQSGFGQPHPAPGTAEPMARSEPTAARAAL